MTMREKVIEVMCDAAGELAERLHLLRLPELLFDLLAIGDILLNGDEIGHLLPVLDRRNRGQFPEQLAVLLLVAKFASPHTARS